MPQNAHPKIGVFGGTFDPVHVGHLIIAEQCRDQSELDQVWFIPAARPPHKQDRPLTPFGQRVEMLALALAGQPAFRIDQLEKDRAGPSYTADTLDELRRQHPAAELWLLLGSDSLADLPHWREPLRIIRQAGLLIWIRPGWPTYDGTELRRMLSLSDELELRQQVVYGPMIDVSSSDLRRRVAEGRSIRYLVPRAVERYIQEKRLYRPKEC
jgi:nicotinate-nucleotide adenylyltransferase